MDRVIKFRVWNGKEYISPDYIDREGFAHWSENSIPQISKHLEQFTGFTDCEGKEIYEGDICEIVFDTGENETSEKGFIIFETGCFYFDNDTDMIALCEVIKDVDYIIVVGNTHTIKRR